MFSLIVEAAKYILGGSSRQFEEPTIDELVARLQNAEDNVDDRTTIADASIGNNHQGFVYRSGIVTKITAEYVLVDKVHMCETTNVNIADLEPGNKIYYMASRTDPSQPMKICKIISLVDDYWEDSHSPDTQNNDIIQVRSIKRRLVAKIARREGRNVFVEPANISINLDKVGSTFVPYVGDWVQLEAMVEIDEDSGDLGGDVLQIDKLQPLRSMLKIGNVTRWDCQIGAGAIDRVTVFNKASCEPGYVPCVGDKVITDSIESDQGIYTWRSVSVVPLEQVRRDAQPMIRQLGGTTINEPSPSLERTNIDALLKDKHGIVITNDLSVTVNAQEEQQLVVKITNTGRSGERVLNRGCFMSKKSQSQLSLVSPSIDTALRINPLASVTYVFRCHGKFVGTSEELFIFIFKGFKIGRIFRITVNEKNPVSRGTRSLVEPATAADKLVTQQDNDQGNYVPGVRPRKSPSFIAVRNGIFRIPQHFWNAVLPCVNEKKSTFESEVAVSEAIPCLSEGLRFENYTTHFHALLYLEEISLRIDLQRYDMANVILAPHGEYLGLRVPGLAEKRPSLIVGDRAIVSFSWDDSGGRVKYEGFVHRVKSCMVLLKFNHTFHETYNSEECQVSFACSYSTIARCHAAIKLATTNLGTEILFPTRVVEQEAQINFAVDPSEEKVKHGPTRDRTGSLSSISSNTSMTSVSDTSSDGAGKNPRISVVERLFHRGKAAMANTDDVDKPKPPTAVCREKLNKYEKLSGSLTQPRNKSDETSSNLSNDSAPRQIDPYVEQLKKRKIAWYNGKLNHHQKEAVRNILKGIARPLPYVIFGPPGTGKTITLCETVLQILTTIPESRLLIATPSNSSANLISERLLDSGVLKPGDLVRLVAHHCLEDDSIPERLLPYCATGDLAAEWSRVRSNRDEVCGRTDRPRTNCTMRVLGRHRITVGTCIALGLLHNMGFPHGHFSHILVDEAGQATEPEIMVPLSMIHSSYGQIVLAGDPMQLGPVVNSRLASHFGLEESFLSRLLHHFPYQRDNEGFGTTGYDPRLVTKLCINYRSLPEILELPNSLFYDSELRPRVSGTKSFEAELVRSMASDLPTRMGRSPPAIIFHGVNGANRQDADSPSWYNPAEATQAYLYLLKLYDRGISSRDIGIITPYRKQVRQIRDLLLELDAECPKVGSVEEFQGQERQVIILSAVRSTSNYVTEDIKHALGFVASPRRLNVAITRARALLIILGNPELLSRDPYWRSVLIYCMERDSYTGCNFLPIYSMDKDFEEPNDENEKRAQSD